MLNRCIPSKIRNRRRVAFEADAAQRSVAGKAAAEAGSGESEESCLPGDACTTIFILIHKEHVPSVLVS